MKGWFAPRYADLRTALASPDLSAEKTYGFGARDHGALQDKIAARTQVVGGWMVFEASPDHTRLRIIIQPALLPS